MSAWEEFRSELVAAFGSHPWERDADTVMGAFLRHPGPTRASGAKIMLRVREGAVRDGWRVLALECGGEPARSRPWAGEDDPAVTVERRLRSWVRNEGRHYTDGVFAEELARRAGGRLSVEALERLRQQWTALAVVYPDNDT